MAGELHTPADDGARARADAVDGEQAEADALADRIAEYAPAGSDARVAVAPEMEARALRAEAEVARLRGAVGALLRFDGAVEPPSDAAPYDEHVAYERQKAEVTEAAAKAWAGSAAAEPPPPRAADGILVPVAPEIAAQLAADWSEPVQFRLVERGDGYEMILRTVAAELSAHGLDPDCSLCAAGHVPGKPCGEPPGILPLDVQGEYRAWQAASGGGPSEERSSAAERGERVPDAVVNALNALPPASTGETFVWADGTIYDASIPGYREATVEERHRNSPGESKGGAW